MASTKKKQQYKTAGTQARQQARTAGHAARRQIDLDYSRQRRQDTRQERAAEEKFKGQLPIWGGRNPLTGGYEFRPGAKEGFWESRSSDWIGQERGAAGGQADWTKIQPPLVKRQPNHGFGFIGGKIMDSIGSRLGNGGQQLQAAPPRPQLALGGGAAAAGAAAGAGATPNRARLKPNSAQPAGPRVSPFTPTAGDLESGVLGLPAPGGEVRNPGEPRRLPSNTGRLALGTGPLALGAGPKSSPKKERRPAGIGGSRGMSRISADLEETEDMGNYTPPPKAAAADAGLPLQSIGNPWGKAEPKRIPGTPVQSIGNPWAYDPRD